MEEARSVGKSTGEKSKFRTFEILFFCERALVSRLVLNKGSYSLAEYSKEYMPIMMESFKGKQL